MTLSEPAQIVAFVAPTLLSVSLFLHILGGSVAIVSGYAAVVARKGAPFHRAAGSVFVVAMLFMAGLAATLGAMKGQSGNLIAGLFTLYLVATAWLTVKRPDGAVGQAEALAALFGTGLAVFAVLGALEGGTDAAGVPRFAGAVFAAVTAMAVACDLKVLVRRGVSGAARISRHLWRMATALFVAAGSFFLGQMDTMPRELHGPHLFVLAFAPLVLMVFWLIRVRIPPRRRPKADTAPSLG